jgi:hypothetical protein
MDFSTALVAEPFRILGLDLRPFSLGHFFHMRRHGVAFAADEPTAPAIGDLVLAVLICSQTFDGFEQLLRDGKIERFVLRWGRKIKQYDFIEKVKIFQRYQSAGCEAPPYWEKDSENKSVTGTHWSQALKCCAVTNLGYGAGEVMDAPLARVLSDYYRWLEAEGHIQVMTREETMELARQRN